jgi:hypothetical protein
MGHRKARPAQRAPTNEVIDIGPVSGAAGDDENTRGAFPERPERPPGSGPAALGFGPAARQNPPGGASFPGYEGGVLSGTSCAAAQPGARPAAAAAASGAAPVKAADPPKPTVAPWDKIADMPDAMVKIEEAEEESGDAS